MKSSLERQMHGSLLRLYCCVGHVVDDRLGKNCGGVGQKDRFSD